MPEHCGRTFDDALLSGYLDHALTQADEQRVRIHLEDCATCRMQMAQLAQLREVTMSTEFNVPSDDQWSGGASRSPESAVARPRMADRRDVDRVAGRLRRLRAAEVGRAVDGEALHLRRVDRLWPPVLGSALGPTLDDEDRSLSGGLEMTVVTSNTVAGRRVVRTLGLVRGNTIRARHIGKDIMAVLRGSVGGEVSGVHEADGRIT